MKMTKKTYNRCLLFLIFIGFCLVPVLYALSDHRPQAVKEVAYEFKVPLSKDVKRLKEIYKEPDFHGDGEAGILLSTKTEEIRAIEDHLSPYEVTKNSKEFAAIEGCLKVLNRRGFQPGLSEISRAYFKQTTDYRYANFIGLIIDEKTNKILYVRWDT